MQTKYIIHNSCFTTILVMISNYIHGRGLGDSKPKGWNRSIIPSGNELTEHGGATTSAIASDARDTATGDRTGGYDVPAKAGDEETPIMVVIEPFRLLLHITFFHTFSDASARRHGHIHSAYDHLN